MPTRPMPPRGRAPRWAPGLALCAGLWLAGCGQKGPLTLPDQAVKSPSPAASAAQRRSGTP